MHSSDAGNPYQDENGVFGDNQFRYALLSLAACEAPLQLNIGGFRYIQALSVETMHAFFDLLWKSGIEPRSSIVDGLCARDQVTAPSRVIFPFESEMGAVSCIKGQCSSDACGPCLHAPFDLVWGPC